MKFSDKIYTYKDIEEAKKLIGKKVVASDNLFVLSHIEDCEEPYIAILYDVSDYMLPFATNKSSIRYQFIREVIDEPKFRPYDSPTELVQDYLEIFKRKDIPKHTLPLIWLKHIPSDDVLLITGFNFDDEYVLTSEGKMTMSELHAEWNYLDGTPCAKRI